MQPIMLLERNAAGGARRRARRLAVVLAARDLFECDGYRPTTIAAIAAQSGVSAESIYKGFGTKAALAKAVFDLALARDVLWNYLAIDHYERLVLFRGWSLERYSRWLAEAITSALCPR